MIKRHISFEMRLFLKSLLIIILFLISFIFIFQAFRKENIVDSNLDSKVSYELCTYVDCSYANKMSSVDVDKIKVNFQYDAHYTEKIKQDLYYYIVSDYTVYTDTGEVVSSDEEVLLDRTKVKMNGDKIRLNVSTTYLFSDRYVDFIDEVGATKNNVVVDIKLIVDDKESDNTVGVFRFSYDNSDLTVDEMSGISDNQLFNVSSSYDIVLATIGLLFALFGLLMVIHVSNFVSRCLKSPLNYSERLRRILKIYDKYIVICRGEYEVDPNKRIIEVVSFKELMDARNALSVPIVYEKINNIKCRFYVEDSDKIYLYTMKDIDEEKK